MSSKLIYLTHQNNFDRWSHPLVFWFIMPPKTKNEWTLINWDLINYFGYKFGGLLMYGVIITNLKSTKLWRDNYCMTLNWILFKCMFMSKSLVLVSLWNLPRKFSVKEGLDLLCMKIAVVTVKEWLWLIDPIHCLKFDEMII